MVINVVNALGSQVIGSIAAMGNLFFYNISFLTDSEKDVVLPDVISA